jgi:hypothetical protein
MRWLNKLMLSAFHWSYVVVQIITIKKKSLEELMSLLSFQCFLPYKLARKICKFGKFRGGGTCQERTAESN